MDGSGLAQEAVQSEDNDDRSRKEGLNFDEELEDHQKLLN